VSRSTPSEILLRGEYTRPLEKRVHRTAQLSLRVYKKGITQEKGNVGEEKAIEETRGLAKKGGTIP